MGSTAQEEPKRSKSSSNDEQKSPDVVLQRLDNLMDAKVLNLVVEIGNME